MRAGAREMPTSYNSGAAVARPRVARRAVSS